MSGIAGNIPDSRLRDVSPNDTRNPIQNTHPTASLPTRATHTPPTPGTPPPRQVTVG